MSSRIVDIQCEGNGTFYLTNKGELFIFGEAPVIHQNSSLLLNESHLFFASPTQILTEFTIISVKVSSQYFGCLQKYYA